MVFLGFRFTTQPYSPQAIMFQRISKSAFIQWAAICGAGLFLTVWTYSHIAQSIYVSQYFDGFIANGPFQLFNPLRRIANGQTAGVDFQFFHGIGVPFLHYPLFALFGKSLFASELSRNLTSLICFLSSLIPAYAQLKMCFADSTAPLSKCP